MVRRNQRRRRRRTRPNRNRRNLRLSGGTMQAPVVPRARSLIPWNPLNIMRSIDVTPPTAGDDFGKAIEITFKFIYDAINAQYAVKGKYVYIRPQTIEVYDFGSRPLGIIVYSTIDDITADACPIASEQSIPNNLTQSRVRYMFPLSARQVPLYCKSDATGYIAKVAVGRSIRTTPDNRVVIVITGSWIDGAASTMGFTRGFFSCDRVNKHGQIEVNRVPISNERTFSGSDLDCTTPMEQLSLENSQSL